MQVDVTRPHPEDEARRLSLFSCPRLHHFHLLNASNHVSISHRLLSKVPAFRFFLCLTSPHLNPAPRYDLTFCHVLCDVLEVRLLPSSLCAQFCFKADLNHQAASCCLILLFRASGLSRHPPHLNSQQIRAPALARTTPSPRWGSATETR